MYTTMNNLNGWNLIFEEKSLPKRAIIQISPEKKFKEAINLYKIQSNNTTSSEDLKFIFNGSVLFPELVIAHSGLDDNSMITVLNVTNLRGG